MKKSYNAFHILAVITLFLIAIPFSVLTIFEGIAAGQAIKSLIEAGSFSIGFILLLINLVLYLGVTISSILGIISFFKKEPAHKLFRYCLMSFGNITTIFLLTFAFNYYEIIIDAFTGALVYDTSSILLITTGALILVSDICLAIAGATFKSKTDSIRKIFAIIATITLLGASSISLYSTIIVIGFDIIEELQAILLYVLILDVILACVMSLVTFSLYQSQTPEEKAELDDFFKDKAIQEENIDEDLNDLQPQPYESETTYQDNINQHESCLGCCENCEQVNSSLLENNEEPMFDLPKGIMEIGDHQFAENGQLINAEISNGVLILSAGCFANCYNLRHVVIPSSVKEIKFNAFFNCRKLTDITYKGSMRQFKTIIRGSNWLSKCGTNIIKCRDGNLQVNIK